MGKTLFTHLSRDNSLSCLSNQEERPLVELKDVYKTFITPAGSFTALKGINLTFKSGEFTSVVGKSGSGKSTLINMITGIDNPTSGSIFVKGILIQGMNASDLSVWRGRTMGIVFQFFQLLPMLTVLENVMLPMDFCEMYAPAEREERARSLLKLVELEDCADMMSAELSGGQQQCAAVARALANDPPIIVADEPTGNLDSRTAEVVFQLLLNLEKQGKTIIMVTHDKYLAQRTGRIVLISDGELVNETVARALSWLPHEQMLWLTHHLKPMTIPPGERLFDQKTDAMPLCLIERGQVELVSCIGNGLDTVVKRLGAGDYFTTFAEPLDNLFWRVTSDDASDLLFLDQADFDQWVKGYGPAKEGLIKNLPEGTTEMEVPSSQNAIQKKSEKND
jgi:putative ABC transport system ATP-binding protein